MRKLTRLSLAVLLVVAAAMPIDARAQEAPAPTQAPAETQQAPQTPQAPIVQPPPAPQPQPRAASALPRVFFSVNMAGQAREQTFTESATFTKYNEQGAVATSHAIGGGPLLDLGLGLRLWRGFGVGVAYTAFTDDDDAGITARVPDPVVFNKPRTESTTAPGLEHTENTVHLQFTWIIPYREKFLLAVFAGPSFFTVRQDLATVLPSNIADPPPLIRAISVTNVKESAVGMNVGADGTYRIARMGGLGIGVGAFMRYSQASVELPSAAGATIDEGDLKAGGFQGGGGLRLEF